MRDDIARAVSTAEAGAEAGIYSLGPLGRAPSPESLAGDLASLNLLSARGSFGSVINVLRHGSDREREPRKIRDEVERGRDQDDCSDVKVQPHCWAGQWPRVRGRDKYEWTSERSDAGAASGRTQMIQNIQIAKRYSKRTF